MKYVISGASGFIGSALSASLSLKDQEAIGITREDMAIGNEELLTAKLKGADVVVNLAGTTINRRWTERYKSEIVRSRVDTTNRLVNVINSLNSKPKLFISTSAIGFYPSKGSFTDNDNIQGEGFLSQVCSVWEEAAKNISPQVRLVITRFAPVLSSRGGVFPPLESLFRRRLGGRIGDGKQIFCWVMLSDLIKIFDYIASNPNITGVVNCASPVSCDNKTFTKLLASRLSVSAPWVIPKSILEIILGNRASLVTEGQNAIPQKLIESGFVFDYPDIKTALNALCGREK